MTQEEKDNLLSTHEELLNGKCGLVCLVEELKGEIKAIKEILLKRPSWAVCTIITILSSLLVGMIGVITVILTIK